MKRTGQSLSRELRRPSQEPRCSERSGSAVRLAAWIGFVIALEAGVLAAPACAQDEAGPGDPGPASEDAPPADVGPATPADVDSATPAAPADVDSATSAASAAPASAEAGAVDTIVPTAFRFSGNESIPTPELEALLSDLIGQPCDLTKLRGAADRVTEEYRRRGMDLARAYLPAQEIEGGVVQVVVLEGRFGQVVVEGNRNYETEFVAKHIEAAVEQGALTSERLERSLLILNDYKDLKVSATLERGKEPGTVDVRAAVEDRFPLSATALFTNFGTEYVSRYRFGLQIDWTNAVISGSLLSLAGVIGERPDRLAYGSGSYVFPVNVHGTRVGLSGSYGNFQVAQDLDDLDIHGDQAMGALSVSHPFVKTRPLSLSAELGFAVKDFRLYLLDEKSSHDKIRTVSLGLLAHHVGLGGKSYAQFDVAQGLGSFLDGTESNDPGSSRINADGEFTRLMLQLGRLQPIGESFSVFLKAAGQWSFQSLVAGEEWQVGGADSVRGYAPGESAGDHGYSVTLEVRLAPLENKEILVFVGFFDHGDAFRRQTVIGQDNHNDLTGAGFGVRSHFERTVTGDLRLDVGFPIEPHKNALNEFPVLYASVAIRI